MRLTGIVEKSMFAVGSKHEHEAIGLKTGSKFLKLRFPGANPFNDPSLDHLVGKNIDVDGVIVDEQFLVTNWSLA